MGNLLENNYIKGIIKTRKLGYDGKGQIRVDLKNLNKINLNIKPNNFILEKLIPFDKEISVIAIRKKNGEIKTYEPTQNIHKAGILKRNILSCKYFEKMLYKSKKHSKKNNKRIKNYWFISSRDVCIKR